MPGTDSFAYLLHVYVAPQPSQDVLFVCLFEHVKHLGLKDVVDTLCRNSSATLKHCKDVDDLDSVLVNQFA